MKVPFPLDFTTLFSHVYSVYSNTYNSNRTKFPIPLSKIWVKISAPITPLGCHPVSSSCCIAVWFYMVPQTDHVLSQTASNHVTFSNEISLICTVLYRLKCWKSVPSLSIIKMANWIFNRPPINRTADWKTAFRFHSQFGITGLYYTFFRNFCCWNKNSFRNVSSVRS